MQYPFSIRHEVLPDNYKQRNLLLLLLPPPPPASAAIYTYPRAAAAAAAAAEAAIALKFHPKHATNKNKTKHIMKISQINVNIYDKTATSQQNSD
jgi:hypothetical protein